MKKISYSLLFLLLLTQACKKDGISLYEGKNYIQFSKKYTDSLLYSFLTVTNDDQIEAAIGVELMGNPENRNRTYKIAVVSEASTATDIHYSIPEIFTLGANKVRDTARFILRKTPDISVKPARLVIRIIPTDELLPGQSDHSISILNISNVLAKPGWWNSLIDQQFLGNYSDKKYSLFSQVTGMSELNINDQHSLRYHSTVFKNYLLMEKDAGRTVYEENGVEMTVALIGG